MDVVASNAFLGSLVAGSALLAAAVYVLYGTPWDSDKGKGMLWTPDVDSRILRVPSVY